jgi:exopolysaccharide production protein ExoZ
VSRNIQGLRFVAALWVAIYHLNQLFGLGLEQPWVQAFARSGYAGVDIFFVISGYIMALTTDGARSGLRNAGHFLSQRFARIYCGWWPFFLIYLGFAIAAGGPDPQVRLLQSFFLWPTLLPHHLVPIAWTLSFELFFYACTAAVLLWSRRRAWQVMLAWAAVVLVLNASWIVQGRYHPDRVADVDIGLWFFFYPLTLEFIAGFLLHELLARRSSLRWGPWLAAAALFAIAIALYQQLGVFYPSGLAGLYHAPERALLWGGLSVCLVAVAVRLEAAGKTPLAWAKPLGDASYSIYLGHILLIQLFLRAHASLGFGSWPKPLLALVVLAAIVAMFRLYYLAIERPLYKAASRLINRLFGAVGLERELPRAGLR